MITPFMTSEEISNQVDKDRERIDKFISYRFKEMERELRKGLIRRKIYKIIDYKCGTNKYKIILYIENKFHTFSLLIHDTVTNELIDVTYSWSGQSCPVPYTARSIHFFRRYAERYLQDPDKNINDVILEYYKDYSCSIVMYQKDDKLVYASRDGLALAVYDKKRQINHVVTFISLNLLKDSQFIAWLKAQRASIKIDKLAEEELKSSGRLTPDSTHFWQLNEEETFTLNEASELYDMYFKYKDLEDVYCFNYNQK